VPCWGYAIFGRTISNPTWFVSPSVLTKNCTLGWCKRSSMRFFSEYRLGTTSTGPSLIEGLRCTLRPDIIKRTRDHRFRQKIQDQIWQTCRSYSCRCPLILSMYLGWHPGLHAVRNGAHSGEWLGAVALCLARLGWWGAVTGLFLDRACCCPCSPNLRRSHPPRATCGEQLMSMLPRAS
jgi:hypothetical protein